MPNQKFERIYCEVHRFLNSSGLIEDYSNYLISGNPIGDILRTYTILKDANLLPKPVKKVIKSDKLSAKCRSEGNESFKKKEDIMALKHYTKAVASAPSGKELALAYANRSAVTYSLAEYKHCMRDIDRALKHDYPEKLKYKLLERKGKCLSALKRTVEAAVVFNDALELLPKSELDLSKKNEIKKNLENYLKKCNEESQQPTYEDEDDVCNLPELSHPSSDYIQVASNAVDICFTKGMGRHILAATDLYPGDVIAVEKPFASILLPSMYNFFCFFCKKRCHSLLPCLHCTEVLFCSEKCRTDGWEQSHCIECNLLPTLINIGCENMELLAAKILLLASCSGKRLGEILRGEKILESCDNPREKGFTDGKYLSDNYKSTHNLEMNDQVRKVDDVCRRLVMATCILYAIEECTDFFDYAEKSCAEIPHFKSSYSYYMPGVDVDFLRGFVGALLFRYLLSVPCNAHEVSEMRLKPTGTDYDYGSVEIGGAIYPFLSLINHSCDPNVVRHNYCGDLVALIAIQVIKQGEQIFDNYSYHHAIHTKEQRQSHLLSQYYFVCKCDACLYDWPPYVDLPEKNPIYFDNVKKEEVEKSSEKFKDVLKEICSGKIEGQLSFLYKHLTLLHNNISRPWKEYNQCQEAIKQCLSKLANHYEYKSLIVDD